MKLRYTVLLFLILQALTQPEANADEFDSNGVKIHYNVYGQGEPVILIHGLYSSARMNWEMPGTVKELATRYQVIDFDNRGHGSSGKPTEEGSYGTQMCDDVIRLMNHLDIQKAKLVGYSMGGMIVMKLLAMHPERFNSAVLGGMGWLRQGGFLDRFWAGLPSKDKGQVPAACLRGFSELAVSADELERIKVPITIIAGDRDPCRRLYIMPLHRIRPDVPIMTVRGAGHCDCIVKPEFKAELESALASAK